MKAYAPKPRQPECRGSSNLARSSAGTVRLQAKLRVNASGDIHEQQADRVAEQVSGGPATTSVPGNDIGAVEAPSIVNDSLRSSGQPLDPTTRAVMEPRFGHDFSGVRVHAGSLASDAASSIGARAFTVDRDIVFGADEYAPHTPAGRKLLSHELTHVIQQRSGVIQRKEVGDESTSASETASPSWKERVAEWVTGGAEAAHEVYEFFDAYATEHPLLTGIVNGQIDLASMAIGALIDTNPDTLGWLDLGTMWLFELGANPMQFDENARTTKELQAQEGVEQVRELARAELAKGTLSPVKKTWTYGQQAFYDGLRQGNLATSFLGSYKTKAFLTAGPDDSAILELEVENVSSWESGTRLRKAAKNSRLHQGIIPNRSRGGAGLHLGGNMTQFWNWSEPLKK